MIAKAIEVPHTIGVIMVISRVGSPHKVDVTFFAAVIISTRLKTFLLDASSLCGLGHSHRESNIVQLPRVHVETLVKRSASAQMHAKSVEEHGDVAR